MGNMLVHTFKQLIYKASIYIYAGPTILSFSVPNPISYNMNVVDIGIVYLYMQSRCSWAGTLLYIALRFRLNSEFGMLNVLHQEILQ